MRRTGPSEEKSVRALRVGEQLRHALSDVLMRGDIHDELLAHQPVAITEVRMSPDLRHATVFVKAIGGVDDAPILVALKRNARYLRGEVARRVNMKYAADLKFLRDDSFDEGDRIDTLLRSLAAAPDSRAPDA